MHIQMATVGTDVLFENHTVKEIQEIEKKLRNDIERKKEELRQMVGERYRDLMEAADTITEMKEIAESVTSCVKSIENRCVKLQSSSLQKGILYSIQDKVAEKKKTNELFYVIASQIKILMDSPSEIWSSIERRDFVSAVSLYLLARHVHSLLVLNPSYQERNTLSQFPVINRQWVSIAQFKSVLILNSQIVLDSQEAEPEDVLGPLCCNCLLSKTSLQQTFLYVLDTRKNVLKNIFKPEKYAKTQVCEFINVVQLTLKIIYIIFYPLEDSPINNGDERNLLYQSLMKLISTKNPGPVSLLDLKSSEIFKFLPIAVTDFRPVLSSPPTPCPAEFLQSKCKDWLEDIKTSLQPELRNLLNFVNSIKNLSLIQEALFVSLCEVKNWDIICNSLLQQSFSLWDFFLRDCFLQRIEEIINERVKTASEFCQKDIEETLYKIGNDSTDPKLKQERNISLYVWSESPHDVINNIAWHPRHHRNFWNSGELSMKAMGFTPKVQSICKDLDQRIQDALEDISYFSCVQNQFNNDHSNLEKEIAYKKFMTETNKSDVISNYLSQAMKKHFNDLSNFIETTLSYFESEEDTPEKSNRIVFLGHVCNGIANLCPHINSALMCEKLNENFFRGKQQGSKLSLSSVAIKENEQWKPLKSELLQTSASAFRLWSKDQINNLISSVEAELITNSAEGLLKILLQWDKVEIQEESEQGNSIKSVLRIPQHISTPVFNALFSFCCKLNIIGGFSISSEVRLSISKELLIALLEIYKQKVCTGTTDFNSRLLQVQSLQLLFDVQFLMGLMVHKDNTCEDINRTSQKIIDVAVSRIDPFDMDVFFIPLQQNVKKALQKSLSLFGLITSPDQVSYLNSFKSYSVSSQMEHNVMLSSTAGSRFPLLPLPSRTNVPSLQEQFQTQPKEAEVKNIQSHSSSPNLSVCDTPTNPLKSTASFYEKMTAMSSSWFGN